jgi:arylsulfatase A-like enzyme
MSWRNIVPMFTVLLSSAAGSAGEAGPTAESARVPLVMRWPKRIKPGQRTAALCQLFDIYPTIVEAIGGRLSAGHFARSLLAVATGQKNRVRDAVFAEIGHQQSLNYMVRTPRYAWWVHNGKESLYDMQEDPYQLTNLIDSQEHGDVLAEIRARHLAYFKTTQVNLSAGYKPLLERAAEAGGGKKKGLSDRLHEQYREAQGIKTK